MQRDLAFDGPGAGVPADPSRDLFNAPRGVAELAAAKLSRGLCADRKASSSAGGQQTIMFQQWSLREGARPLSGHLSSPNCLLLNVRDRDMMACTSVLRNRTYRTGFGLFRQLSFRIIITSISQSMLLARVEPCSGHYGPF